MNNAISFLEATVILVMISSQSRGHWVIQKSYSLPLFKAGFELGAFTIKTGLSWSGSVFDFTRSEHNKQLLDGVEHDIMNYQNRGLCYLLIIHDIMRKPNSIIVLLHIFQIIHPQKQKRSVQPFFFEENTPMGLVTRQTLNLTWQAIVNWLNALNQ